VLANCGDGFPAATVADYGTGRAFLAMITEPVETDKRRQVLQFERRLLRRITESTRRIIIFPNKDVEWLLSSLPDGTFRLLLINHGSHGWQGGAILRKEMNVGRAWDVNGSHPMRTHLAPSGAFHVHCRVESQGVLALGLATSGRL